MKKADGSVASTDKNSKPIVVIVIVIVKLIHNYDSWFIYLSERCGCTVLCCIVPTCTRMYPHVHAE